MGIIRSRESGLCLDSIVLVASVYPFAYQTDISGISIIKLIISKHAESGRE